ncbi:LysR family transcriptional regulator [Rhizobacter sp. J219]|jgi:DNA-binding transcriptional LysR family regulator|uniref:LysR family transcriptional regulator n=1 Tax=Rhizobacter sp. J219 TaxID=2898430 RepID=UPI002150B2DD|nr:LysR family transcriptional regulator [Rhizobacter sp. J219]MCR5885777.1 LysR family transcriptional regulator [Rhizobacter sp. J219]
MDSDALDTFLAVHRHGGVSAAALALSRTQSAISRRLAVLEAAVGAPLFERIGRGLVLSDVGRALLPHAERVTAAVGDARAAVQAAQAGTGGVVQMVTVGTLAHTGLAAALKRARAAQPQLDLRLQTATSAQVSELVRSGAAAVGLRYFADPSPDLDCRVVQTEHLVVACAASHPLAGKRVASLSRLAGERWLAFPVQDRHSEFFAATVFAQFTTRGVHTLDWVAIDSLSAQKRLVEAGFGLALLQASAVADELARRELALIRVGDLDASVPVALVTRRGAYLSGGAQALIAQLHRLGKP